MASLNLAPTRAPILRWLAAAAGLALMGVVTYLSSLSQPDLPPGPWAWSDKLTHAAVYAVIGASWSLAAPRADVRAALFGFALATLFGASDEWHQSYTPGRDASGLDLLADAVGAAAGAFALTWYSARRCPRAPAPPPSSASAGSSPASPPTSSSPITSR